MCILSQFLTAAFAGTSNNMRLGGSMKILVKTWSATEDFACYIIKGWGEAEYNLGSLFFKLSLPGGTHPKTQWVAPGQVLIW